MIENKKFTLVGTCLWFETLLKCLPSDLCLNQLQIYFPIKPVGLVETVPVDVESSFASHIYRVWMWWSNCLRLNLWEFIHILIMRNIHIGRKWIILRWNVAISKWVYWLLDENNIFMQNYSAKQHMLFALRDVFTQECRDRNKWS